MARKHNRKLVLGAVALVPGRVRHAAAAANEVRAEIEAIMIQSNYLEGAPFEWVGLILRYGDINADTPEIEAVNRENGDLPVAIELSMEDLKGASKEEVCRRFREATLKALVAVGKKYGLLTYALEGARAH